MAEESEDCKEDIQKWENSRIHVANTNLGFEGWVNNPE